MLRHGFVLLGLVQMMGLGWPCLSLRAEAGSKQVLTTFTILQDMAQNVAGDRLKVQSITKPGSEIHGYEPTPGDLVRSQKADLILWNGMNLERWFEKFFVRLKGVPGALLTEGIEPMSITEGPYQGKINPHAWMSPRNALIYVENIRLALSKLTPEHAGVYAANARAYGDKIRAIDSSLRQTLETIPQERRWLATSEGAFSYLARDFQMKAVYLWPINADQQGTPQQVQKMIDTIRREKIPVVFSESTVSDKAARQIAAETGARYGGVLYVDSLTGPEGPAPTYLQLMEANARTIQQGFVGTKQP